MVANVSLRGGSSKATAPAARSGLRRRGEGGRRRSRRSSSPRPGHASKFARRSGPPRPLRPGGLFGPPSRSTPAATDANSAVQSFDRRDSRLAQPRATAARIRKPSNLTSWSHPSPLGRGFHQQRQLRVVGRQGPSRGHWSMSLSAALACSTPPLARQPARLRQQVTDHLVTGARDADLEARVHQGEHHFGPVCVLPEPGGPWIGSEAPCPRSRATRERGATIAISDAPAPTSVIDTCRPRVAGARNRAAARHRPVDAPNRAS